MCDRLGSFEADDQFIFGRLPNRALGVTMLPSSRPSKAVEWTCPIGAVIGAGPKQSILLNVAAPRAFVRQMESTSHDPFATLATCGRGRTGCTRHNLAGNGVCSGTGAAARGLFPDLPFGQRSRLSARGWSARRRGGGVLLPRRAARRSP